MSQVTHSPVSKHSCTLFTLFSGARHLRLRRGWGGVRLGCRASTFLRVVRYRSSAYGSSA